MNWSNCRKVDSKSTYTVLGMSNIGGMHNKQNVLFLTIANLLHLNTELLSEKSSDMIGSLISKPFAYNA